MYSFDTSALIDGMFRLYRPKNFPSLWQERQAEVQCLHVVATNEFSIRFMVSLVLDAAGHRVPAVHPYGLIEHGPHRAAHVTHVVFPNLSRKVCEALWVLGTRGIEQDPKGLNGVSGNTDNSGLQGKNHRLYKSFGTFA